MERTALLSRLTDFMAYWLTLYGECRGEKIEGQLACASVIRRRAQERRKSIKEVCLEPLQFSCWNVNDPNFTKILNLLDDPLVEHPDEDVIHQLKWIAQGMMEEKLLDNTDRANHYLATWLWSSPSRPSWAKGVKEFKVIGSQVFFRL
jgi:N-acetylmuramoyl-L-alanine amidase